jgi:hypothetical protein
MAKIELLQGTLEMAEEMRLHLELRTQQTSTPACRRRKLGARRGAGSAVSARRAASVDPMAALRCE